MEGYQAPRGPSTRPRIGIPRTLLFYDLFPYWHRFLVELGADVRSRVASGESHQDQGREETASHQVIGRRGTARIHIDDGSNSGR